MNFNFYWLYIGCNNNGIWLTQKHLYERGSHKLLTLKIIEGTNKW